MISKKIILTGGAGDIARVAAAQFLREGAQLMLVDNDETALHNAVASLSSEQVAYCVADVTSAADTQRYIETAMSRFGRLDVLMANAGIEGNVAPVSEYDEDMYDKVMAVNVKGVFLALKYAFPVMAASGGGSVIITSSIAGLRGHSGLSAYNTSKHAVIGLMRSAAIEGAEHNIRVNTINPSPVDSRMIQSLEAQSMPDDPALAHEQMQASVPLQRFASPADVANLMSFLATDDSAFLTGGVYSVDGGQSAG